MRAIGIDPGTRRLGWGVLARQGSRLWHLGHGVIAAPPEGSLADRLLAIDEGLAEVLAAYRPAAGAVESIFFAKNAQSASKLGHARGVVLLRLRRAAVPIYEYSPALVKRAVVGRGRAEKRQVSLVVAAVLGLREPPPPDAADALALGLTHLNCAGFAAALARAGR
ncbi:MAG: crossover junction endodeoxyribonuclease RuvC [Deltaproteobacteria bacterium]|nr:crossover junction endodeoxyribonuclease RuvC [Deltaproteobacteria bacterium]